MTGLRSFALSDHISEHEMEVREARQAAEFLAPDASVTFYPGEPIYAPPRRRGSTMGEAMLAVTLMGFIGWGLFATQDVWRPWVSPLVASVLAEIERAGAPGAPGVPQEPLPPSTAEHAQHLLPAAAVTARDVAAAPGAAAGEAAPAPPAPDVSDKATQEADASSTAAADTSQPADGTGEEETAKVEPLPPLHIDQSDPYQKRALTAGLHPDLSRALLSRLNEDDYRNARTAIAKAIAEVPDTGKLVWPKQRAPERALFTVHFVKGASGDCRRYVVTVLKDRWTTTALPMERCGVKRPAARRAAL
ncbi:MAG: hypothetical protein KDJ47_06380 [Hyphomicrobiaceae bacterium]|nr:hypothetical protein [Hyphomicrobiaceae bacterium]